MAGLMKHPEVVYTDLEEGAVLLHLGTRFYYSLNEVGCAIWRLLDSVEGPEDLTKRVAAAFEVEEGRAKGSVSKFLQELEREQLVSPRQEGSGLTEMERSRHEGSAGAGLPSGKKKPFVEPELIKHDEPLHEIVMNPFDPQLPLAE